MHVYKFYAHIQTMHPDISVIAQLENSYGSKKEIKKTPLLQLKLYVFQFVTYKAFQNFVAEERSLMIRQFTSFCMRNLPHKNQPICSDIPDRKGCLILQVEKKQLFFVGNKILAHLLCNKQTQILLPEAFGYASQQLCSTKDRRRLL